MVMTYSADTLRQCLPDARLQGMLRGVEKESLRSTPEGRLALTPHPVELGSPLMHPNITTDFSESQLELVTGVHASAQACLDELTQIHQEVYRVLGAHGDEALWAASMPCGLPTDETIPLGRYGRSNIGRAKSVYRMGLGNRYGRRMQTISGIHYNWSLPDTSNEAYFGLIRNFRRQSFLLLYLFGASPVVCGSFVEGRVHGLQPLGTCGSMHLPYATSLRMGRLGYQSDAQAALHVSYNSLDSYAASLHDALTLPYPPYEAIGIRNLGGEYNQLDTSLLQIENEFYSTIRPKRVIEKGERPLHALRQRGVQYVEVRLMDLNPFMDVGIDANTMRFLDLFLLHCLCSDSPQDSLTEIEEVGHNQHLTASRGREPGLQLQRDGRSVGLVDWATQILTEMEAVAQRLDAWAGGDDYQQALRTAWERVQNPALLPSAQVLQAVQAHDDAFVRFVTERSVQARVNLQSLPLPDAQTARFKALAEESLQAQQAIEAADTLSFEDFRKEYVSPLRLKP